MTTTPASNNPKDTSDVTERSLSSQRVAIRVTFHDDSVKIFPLNAVNPDDPGWRWSIKPSHGPAEQLVIRPEGKGIPRFHIPIISIKFWEVIPLPLEWSPADGEKWDTQKEPRQVWRGTMDQLRIIMGLPEGWKHYMTAREHDVIIIQSTPFIQPPKRDTKVENR